MTLTFADTQKMIAYLTKSDTSVVVKKVNDVTRLQALVDKKRVIITKATIRDALRLDDAEGVECLPNEAIFVELARIGGRHGMSLVSLWHLLSSAYLQTLIDIKAAKPKARGVIVQKPSEFRITSSLKPLQLPQAKDKGKGIMVEPEKPLKKKDQIAFNEEVSRKLEAQMKAETKEKERITKEKYEAKITVIEQLTEAQAKIDADMELARKLQTEEREKLTNAEKARLFMEFLEKRRKFFERKIEIEKRNRPPTKAQQRNLMCTYLKNIDGWKLKNLKKKSFDKIQKLFDSVMKRVNTFMDMNTEIVEERSKKTQAEQKLDEQVEVEVDNDQREAETKMYMKIIPDDEIEIDAIPLATKPLIIFDWKIIKEGKISSYHLIRAYGSSKRYSLMIQMLHHIDRKNLETL
nr:hypothetical protein [Tanacetum cinerariifolium]